MDVDLYEVIYERKCNKCNQLLRWLLEPDPDALLYRANCCGFDYVLELTRAQLFIEPGERRD